MRVAVVSDVHGNLVAFDAVLGDLRREPVDRVVCLGDMVQGGAQPAETVARLRELAWPVVMGNADAFLLTGTVSHPGEAISEQQLAARAWSLARLSAADRALIEGFRPTVEVDLGDGRGLLAFHGSPASFDDVILPETAEAEVDRLLRPHLPSLLTGGHTHLQQIRPLGASYFFNPGSVGFAYARHQPRETFRASPWAEYAIVSVADGRSALDFRRVAFDTDAYVRAACDAGTPAADEISRRYRPVA